MDEQALNNLLTKFNAKQLTEQEHQKFTNWLSTAPEEEVKQALETFGHYFENNNEVATSKYDHLFEKIELKLDAIEEIETTANRRSFLHNKLRTIAAAAVLLVIGSVAILLYKTNAVQTPALTKISVKKSPVKPGTNRAVLTLANGSAIELNTAKNGRLAVQSNFSIIKLKDGQLVYKLLTVHNKNQQGAGYNTITTPRGGQYQVTLPDGSKVWLNAASSIKYQATFAGEQRRVILEGEAYFEVAKNKLKPFIVSFNNTEVKVLGTHFNIMSYTDEPKTHTTLLEGSVLISNGLNSKTIVPGEQACVGKNICVVTVDTAQVVGWKNGNFTFAHEKINTVMNKIARWYDVDIEYQDNITREDFIGTVPRSKNLGEVLHKLELTGLLHFKVKERRVIVMR